MTRLSGWGKYPVIDVELLEPRNESEIAGFLKACPHIIARGNGRSYGDPALGPEGTLSMLRLNHMIAFNETDGTLVAEAGVLLADILETFVPRGWFPPVTPGTKFVTLGGMIAADVHGKNHVKQGSFGRHVQWFDLAIADGTVVRCARDQNSTLFADTIGGMGLTGIILRCCIQLMAIECAYMRQNRIAARDLEDVIDAFDESEEATYRVAWIDCLARTKSLGRAILDIAEHADISELPVQRQPKPLYTPPKKKISVPLTPPVSPINGFTTRLFNLAKFHKDSWTTGESVIDYETYFYPLDSILHWNRMYGPKGFAQYQCVLPRAAARDGLRRVLREISESDTGSFLSVLKRLGPQNGNLSFPTDGYTLAVDFPLTERAVILMARLDAVVADHGGWLYLAKDSRQPRAIFEKMQPHVDGFRSRRRENGAFAKFHSLQSERLGL